MTPQRLITTGIMPALTELATLGIPSTLPAARFLLAIALQESNLTYRQQMNAGPAASFWQFEKGGGCKGVLAHRSTSAPMARVCADFNVTPDPQGLWIAMRYNDIVAAVAARLLVYTLPRGLPMAADEGWSQYLSAWRPGEPHPERWASCWDVASRAVGVPA